MRLCSWTSAVVTSLCAVGFLFAGSGCDLTVQDIEDLIAQFQGVGEGGGGGSFAGTCDPICDEAEEFCDSDCDGWFDSVEVEYGFDPCDPSQPDFSPDPGTEAPFCFEDQSMGGMAKAAAGGPAEWNESLEAQRLTLMNE